MLTTVFSELDTAFSNCRDAPMFSIGVRLVILFPLGSVRIQPIRWNGNPLLTAHPGHFICMHQGRHLSPMELHSFHQHAFLPPLGKSCILRKGLRIKTYDAHIFWNNIKVLFPGLSPPRLSPWAQHLAPFPPSSP
jgi:hypothetical protein